MWKLYVLIIYILEFQRFSCIKGMLLDFKCPHKSQWSKRAKVICELAPEMYHCLNDTNSKTSTEKCIQLDDLPPGFKSVFTGNRNAEKCSMERFSPFMSWTNDGFECEYKKSVCLEEGQIMYDIGTSTRDTACRCDYTRGYAFAVVPTEDCFCYPWQEDCTCYIKRCSDPNYSLTSDYSCLGKHQVLNYTTCSRISTEATQNTFLVESTQVCNAKLTSQIQDLKILLLILWIVILLSVFCLLMLLIKYTFPEIESFQDIPWSTNIKEIQSALRQYSVIVLKGRRGTGKSTLASFLSCSYANSLFRLEKTVVTGDNFTISPNVHSYTKCLVLFENISQFSSDRDKILKNVKRIFSDVRNVRKDAKFIITGEYIFKEFVDFLEKEMTVRSSDVTFDLDNETVYTIDDKKNMFRFHLSKAESKNIVSRDLIDKIVCKYPVYGFPLVCKWFCSNKDHIDQGVRFFEQPPVELVQKIEHIRQKGELDHSYAKQYCLLVSVMLIKGEDDNFQNILFKVRSMLRELYPNKCNPKDVDVTNLRAIVDGNGEFVKLNEKNISFVHPSIAHAVMISFANVQKETVLNDCDVIDILTLIRPITYTAKYGEVVLLIDKNHYSALARRIAKEFVGKRQSDQEKITTHLANFTSHDNSLLELFNVELEKIKHK